MKNLLNIVVLLVLMSCGSSQTSVEKDRAYQNLKDMVDSKNFEIRSNYAKPMASVAFMQVANSNILGFGNTATNIDISGTSNLLRIKGDSIQGYLPFFGERYFGSTMGSNHDGIEFYDVPKNYKVKKNDDKRSVEIAFDIDDQYQNNEHYNINIQLYSNNTSNISVQSVNRSIIDYSGRVKPVTEDKKNK